MRPFVLFGYASLVLCGVGMRAGAHGWGPVGLQGQTVRAIYAPFMSRYYALAATELGLFRTTDLGRTWETLYVYGPRSGIRVRVHGPGDELYLAWGWGSRSDGLWRSTDAGQTWSVLRYMLFPSVLDVRPGNPTTIYLGSDTLDSGLWFSYDGGTNWMRVDSGLPETDICDLRVTRTSNEKVVCGTTRHGAWLSTNQGAFWTRASPVGSGSVSATGWDFMDSDIVVGVSGSGDSCGLWRSTDLGNSWARELAVADPTELLYDQLAGFHGDSGVYAGAQRMWEPMCVGLTNRHVLCVSGGGFYWAGTEDGVFYYDATPAVKEAVGHERGMMRPGLTIVRSMLFLPRDMTEFGSANPDRVPRPVLLDASGRKVMVLRPGANDVRHLPSGVYFVHSSLDTRHSSLPTKVVIQR